MRWYANIASVGGLLPIVTCGCALDGPRYSTEHLEIQTAFVEPLCGGDLQRMELFVENVQEMLGLTLADRIDVFLWDDFSDLPNCPRGATGCYKRGRHSVYTEFSSLNHELIHAMTAELGRPDHFFNEGIASALSGNALIFKAVEPTASLGKSALDVDRGAAAHFTRWLLDTFGTSRWRMLQASRGREDDFAKIYGVTLADAQAEYFQTAPWVYPPLFQWEAPPLLPASLGWRGEVIFDCASEDTLGQPLGIGVGRTLRVTEAGDYDFWTSADLVTVVRQFDNGVLSMAEAEAGADWDFPVPNQLRPFGRGVAVPGGAIVTLSLEEDQYQLIITDIDRDAERAGVVVFPHLGPVDVIPESP